MKFTCSAQKLIEGLQVVTKALGSRTTNQILEGVLVECDVDSVVLTCSDERITIVTRIEAEIQEAGRGVVPGKLFSEFVRRLSGGDITIQMNERFGFTIRSAQSHVNLAGQDADLFPRLPKMDDVQRVDLPQEMLKDMIQKTEFAIAGEDSREVLTGAYLEIQNGSVTMVALDGFRMALRRVRCADVMDKVSAIIPGRAIGDIGKLLSDNEDDFAELSFGAGKLHIGLGQTDIYVILVQGQYINYRQILSDRFNTKVTMDLPAFRSCVDRAALIAREGSNNLLLLRISGGTMVIEAHSQIGDVREEIEVEQDGADLNIAFNVRYLIDLVRYIDADRVVMNMNSPINPCIITPAEDTDYLHLVLPVRTSATAG